MSGIVRRIGTHDGVFHCDEVLACFLVRKLPEFVCSEIIRTRDMSVLESCDLVVDIGGVYDPQQNRFDHHQRDFSLTMNALNPNKPWTVKLSSAGLIYYHFGDRILRSLLGPNHDPELMEKLFDYVYENFVQEIDGIDNGVDICDGEYKYRVHTDLCSRVKRLNPVWNDKEPHDVAKIFHNAMDLVGKEFIDCVQDFIKASWPARQVVKAAVKNRFNVYETGEVIELETPCKWSHHLKEIEKEEDIVGVIKYVIYPADDSWRVQCVPLEPKSFQCRLFLMESWRGLRNEKLVEVSGIDGSIYVHSTGFIGGNKTREGALLMATKTLLHERIS